VTGSVVLTQPEFNVAGFNQVIAEAALTSGGLDPDAQPFVLVSVRTSEPPGPIPPPEYEGNITWELVLKNTPPDGGGSPRQIDYGLRFRLETTPLPPLPSGDPAPGDPAPAGSQVTVHYEAIFLDYSAP
jgi:hypothetical protein